MSQLTINLYVADGIMMVLAIASAVSTFFERRRAIVRRWRLLMPGLLSAAATLLLIVYPTPRDLFQVQLWMVAVVSILLGAGRGAMLAIFSDHKWGLVRLRRTYDGVLFSLAFVLFATIQTSIEVRAGAENHLEPTMEFLMTVVAGYLLGRSVAGWLRARMIPHEDLYEPIL